MMNIWFRDLEVQALNHLNFLNTKLLNILKYKFNYL